MKVMTVLGEVDADELGFVLPHEHVLINLYRVFQPWREMILNDVDLAVEEVAKFKAAGGGTIVEMTTPDLSRDPKGLVEISRRSGVHIIMGAGFYRESFYGRDLWERTTAEIADELIAEVTNGVEGVRPGVLGEIGTHDAWVSPVEERVHRAVSKAHLATGLTISTHSNATPVGLAQLDLFADAGVDLRRVVIGHCDTYPDPRYHRAILAKGAWVQFDTIRGTYEYQTQRAIDHILGLVSEGHIERILLSQDICVDRHYTVYGGEGYAYLIGAFRSRLRDAGLSDEQLVILFEENPRRMLTGDLPVGWAA